jgi:hypothetical protein
VEAFDVQRKPRHRSSRFPVKAFYLSEATHSRCCPNYAGWGGERVLDQRSGDSMQWSSPADWNMCVFIEKYRAETALFHSSG